MERSKDREGNRLRGRKVDETGLRSCPMASSTTGDLVRLLATSRMPEIQDYLKSQNKYTISLKEGETLKGYTIKHRPMLENAPSYEDDCLL
jgi:hypothetical protein